MAKTLKHLRQVEIIPTSPFHFDSTVYKPAHFPTSDTYWEPGKRWQTMVWKGHSLGLLLENRSTVNTPKMLVHIYGDKPLSYAFVEGLVQEVNYRYNLQLALKRFYRQCGKEPQVASAIRRFRGLRPMHPGSLYEYLIVAIVLQNATVRRSVNMMEALFQRFGRRVRFDDKVFSCFWEPEVLARANEAELRQLKVGYRSKSLLRVSQTFANNEINEILLRQQSQQEQEGVLLSLYGVGPASTGYVMFDVFHHWDYLQHISPWEQKIYTKLFFNKDYRTHLVSVDRMIKFFTNKYGEYKALAIHYVWEDLWWKRKHKPMPWLEDLVRL